MFYQYYIGFDIVLWSFLFVF